MTRQQPPQDDRLRFMIETQRMWREGYRMASPYLGRAWAALIACAGIGYFVFAMGPFHFSREMDPTALLALNPNEGFLHNVLVFGVAGSGVSSFVNTVATGVQPQRAQNVVKNVSKAAPPNATQTPGKRTTTSLTKHALANYLPTLKLCLWESWGIAASGGGGNNYESIELDLMMQGMLSDRLTMPKDTKVLNQIISQAKKADHLNAIHAALFVVPQELLTGMAGQEIITVRNVLKKLRDLGRPVFVVFTKIDQYANDTGLGDDAVTAELRRLAGRLLEVETDKVFAVTNYNSPKYAQAAKRVEAVDKGIVELLLQVLTEACAFQERDPASMAMRRSRNNLNLSSSQSDLRKPSANDMPRRQSSTLERQAPSDTAVPSPKKPHGLAFDALFAQVPDEMKPPSPTRKQSTEQEPTSQKIEIDAEPENNETAINNEVSESNQVDVDAKHIHEITAEQENDLEVKSDEVSETSLRKASEVSLDKSLPTLPPLQTNQSEVDQHMETFHKNTLSPSITNDMAKLSTDITEFVRSETFSTAQQTSSYYGNNHGTIEQDIASASSPGGPQESQRQSQESIESAEETTKAPISHVERMEAFKAEMLNATKNSAANNDDDDVEETKTNTHKIVVETGKAKTEVTPTVVKEKSHEFFEKETPKHIPEQVNTPKTLPQAVQQIEKNSKQKGLLASLNVFSQKEKIEKHEKTTSPTTVQLQSTSTLTSAPPQDGLAVRLTSVETSQTKLEVSLDEFRQNLEKSIRDVSDSAKLGKLHLEELKSEVNLLNATTETIQQSQKNIQETIQITENSIQELKNKTDDLEAKVCLIQHDTIPASLAADKELLETKTQELNSRIDKVTRQQREAEKTFDEHVASNEVQFKQMEELEQKVKELLKFRLFMEDLTKGLRKEVEALKAQNLELQKKAACNCVIS